jgi:uncharacterized membrane protein YjgN (DUF898 family)
MPAEVLRSTAIQSVPCFEHPHVNSNDFTTVASPGKHCSFHGTTGTLFGMQIVNLCLTIATLGAYHFWGTAEVRRYLFSHTAFDGDRFAYHGTGKELYQGFLKAMVLFGIPYFSLGAVHTLLTLPRWADLLSQSLAALILFFYVPIALVSARRYRCSRTSWRGIRFSFRGRTKDFVAIYVRGWLFTVLTLGSFFPYFQTQRQAFLHGHTYFGNQRFHFSGHGSGLVVPFTITLLVTYAVLFLCGLTLALHLDNGGLALFLIPFVVGPTWIWLLARKHRYFWKHTSFGEAHFSSAITWQSLLTLYVGNLALLLITLGLAWPWITIRNARFFTGTLSLHGPTNFDQIRQETTLSSVTGEGLSNLFGNGFDMD